MRSRVTPALAAVLVLLSCGDSGLSEHFESQERQTIEQRRPKHRRAEQERQRLQIAYELGKASGLTIDAMDRGARTLSIMSDSCTQGLLDRFVDESGAVLRKHGFRKVRCVGDWNFERRLR